MLSDTAAWQKKEDEANDDDTHKLAHRLQYAHTQEAAKLAGASLRDDSGHFDQWIQNRHDNILTYRDQSAVSSVSGKKSLTFDMPWVQMFTDDKFAYLAWCKAKSEALRRD
jgi:hypothetical protein